MKIAFLAIILLIIHDVKATFVQNRGVGRSADGGGGLDGLRGTQLGSGDFEDKQGATVTVTVDGEKVIKVKLNEKYLGIPVEGASVVVEYAEDDVDQKNPFVDFGIFFEKEYLQQYITNVETSLTSADLEEIIADNLNTDDFASVPCQQWIYPIEQEDEDIWYHVFKCDVHSSDHDVEGPSIVNGGATDPSAFDWRFIINAKNGVILDKIDILHSAAVGDYSGNDRTGYGTYSNFPSKSSSYLWDDRAIVYDCNRGTGSCPAVVCSTSTDCEPTAEDVNNAKGVAFLAYKYVIDTFDCYHSYAAGESPVSIAPLPVRVHYRNAFENAFWNGWSITFGDGGNTFYPLVSMDVVAHELGHGYTDGHSDLYYRSHSGGMNEAYSDLAGAACEYYSKGTYNWMVGEDIFKASGKALRYMNDPPEDGHSIDKYANFYTSMDPHYSSGVYNKAFYNMVQNGLSIQDVFHTATYANKMYWTAGSTMPQGAEGMIDAADDLSINQWAVEKAFISVGVLDGKCPDFTDYQHCASEGGTCTIPSNVQYGYVSYGVNGQYILMPFTNYRGGSWQYVCNNNIGDIHQGIAKHCCYTKQNTITGFDTVSWNSHIPEGWGWIYYGLLQQRYGYNNAYVYRPVYKTTLWCDNTRFGDNAPGHGKHCNYKWGAPIPVNGWILCGHEGGQCTGLEPGSAHWIRYGTWEKYLYQLIIGRDGSVPCTNSVFDDSHVGTGKYCWKAPASYDMYGRPLFEQPDPKQLPVVPAPDAVYFPYSWVYFGGYTLVILLVINVVCIGYWYLRRNNCLRKTKKQKYIPVNVDSTDQEV